MKTIKYFLGVIVSIYIAAGIALVIMQRDFLYHPTEKYHHTLKTEYIQNDGESIELLVLNEGKEDAVIYFGGNGESVLHSAQPMTAALPEHTAYFVNYRGYSRSSGQPTEVGLYSDAIAIYDALKVKYQNISLIGRSLGTGIATYIAAIREIKKLVLITPYDSIKHIAQDRFPIFPMSLLLKDRFLSSDRAKNITSKTLVILAENDLIIPRKYSTNLIQSFPKGSVETKIIPNTGHNNLSKTHIYYSAIEAFMQANN